MSEEPKECPVCGNTCGCLLKRPNVIRYYYNCPYCGFEGPSARNDDAAINRWNALPQYLKWQKYPNEQIKCEDYYWFRNSKSIAPAIIGYAYLSVGKDMSIWRVRIGAQDRMLGNWIPTYDEFAGPIPKPV